MSGRGRGGGGGRGRGRTSLSFNVEQLGLAPGELLPGPVLQPPSIFPPLEFKPAPLLNSSFYESQLLLKSSFLEYFSKSSAFISLKSGQHINEQFSDAEPLRTCDKPFDIDWNCVPPELKPSSNKRKRQCGNKSNTSLKNGKRKVENLTSWLEELEKKETMDEGKEKEKDDIEKKKEEDGQEPAEGEELEEDDLDEEMDDGTDYNQNYFDNGEGYLDDEDDNLDDGPVY